MEDSGEKRLVSVVMPAYNEASHIVPSIKETVRTLDGFQWDYDLVVVDDGSHDGTFEKIEEFSRQHPRVSAVRIPANRGKGNALRRGFRATRKSDYIVFLDCDLDLHPRQIQTLFQVMKRTGADVVIGSKRHRQSEVDYPWHRRVVSTVYFLMVRILLGMPLRDTQTGLKLFRREVLQKVLPRLLVKRWAFDLELLALAHHDGFKIAHAPVVLKSQRDRSRIRPTAIVHTFWDTLAVFYRMRILRWYDHRYSRRGKS